MSICRMSTPVHQVVKQFRGGMHMGNKAKTLDIYTQHRTVAVKLLG